jgi:hypothetical protein
VHLQTPIGPFEVTLLILALMSYRGRTGQWEFRGISRLARFVRLRQARAISTGEAAMAKGKEKTFSLHWGSGIIEEEAQFETEYHRPTLQLLKFTAGEAAGSYAIRFCHYDHRGGFQRSPLIIDARELTNLKKALRATPKLRKLLGGVVSREKS